MDTYKVLLPLDKIVEIQADDFNYDNNRLVFQKEAETVAVFNTNTIIGFMKVMSTDCNS